MCRLGYHLIDELLLVNILCSHLDFGVIKILYVERAHAFSRTSFRARPLLVTVWKHSMLLMLDLVVDYNGLLNLSCLAIENHPLWPFRLECAAAIGCLDWRVWQETDWYYLLLKMGLCACNRIVSFFSLRLIHIDDSVTGFLLFTNLNSDVSDFLTISTHWRRS